MTSCISAPRNSFTGSHRYDVSSGSPPLADPTRNSPADRGFYSWASIGSVTLPDGRDRKSTRLNSSHLGISYAVFCLKKKKNSATAPASRHHNYAASQDRHRPGSRTDNY